MTTTTTQPTKTTYTEIHKYYSVGDQDYKYLATVFDGPVKGSDILSVRWLKTLQLAAMDHV